MCINFKFILQSYSVLIYQRSSVTQVLFLLKNFKDFYLHVNFKRNVLVFYNNGYNSIPIGNRSYCDALLL